MVLLRVKALMKTRKPQRVKRLTHMKKFKKTLRFAEGLFVCSAKKVRKV